MDAFHSRFREVGTVLRRSMNPTLREVEMPTDLLEGHIALYTEDEWYFVADAAKVRDYVRRGWVLLDEGVELKGD